MERLTYLVLWGKHKETAWSGTNYSLYKALSALYQVKDIDLKFPKLISVFMHRILRFDWFTGGYYEMLYFRKKYKDIKGKVLQMSSYVDSDAETQSYIYNDLSVSYVEYMKDKLPQVFAVSGFQRTNPAILRKQAEAQARFYDRCSAVFCMGHWLKSFLVENGLPEDKVIHMGGVLMLISV